MSIQSRFRFSQGLTRVALLAAGFAALMPTLAASDDDRGPLGYFKNYFVTGDYAVAGVGLRGTGVGGFANGTINMTSVPAGADVIAAFLYWQTVETTPRPSAFNGFFRGRAVVGKPIGDPMNAACWSSGGTTGPKGSSGRVYRADVLRYLAIDSVNNVRLGNGAHSVRLVDSGGNGNGNAPFTNGASLVVVYRIVTPGNPTAVPLRSVVIYDGAYTASKKSDEFEQEMGGFYQASSNAAAKMTHIVGNGQPGFRQTIKVNDIGVRSNQFVGSSGSRWDNPTFNFNLSANASKVESEVELDDNQGCLTWGAVITSTNVTDTDRDGLLDTWETRGLHLNPGTATKPATFGGCADYPAESCVNLPRMGAVNGARDIFVEIDWLRGSDHLHQPKLAALTQVADVFKNRGVRVHFDVGSNYQSLATGPDFFVVPSAHAQGGQVLDESRLVCRTSPCVYNTPYSVMSFKKGFASVKDGNPNLSLPAHFNRDRKDIFHYTLFAHALAGPFNPATGQPFSPDPKTISGVADRPGGDILVTLGLWRSDIAENDQVGSATVQAGTLMHELGHNMNLLHAGQTRTPVCMPNYPSVMNYLYQTRGLTAADGSTRIDFSPGTLSSLNENSLSETAGLGPLTYKLRYYGPVNPNDPPNSAAKLRCDGSPANSGTPMLRLENNFPNFIDWNNSRDLTANTFGSDINFSGQIGDGLNGSPLYNDSNDWANLNLQQVGARTNVNGLSTDVGAIELGAIELGAIDLGAIELGAIDLGAIDLGAIELGAIELGDVDYETAVLSTVDPPPPPSPDCPTCGLRSTNLIDRITLNWTAPTTGAVANYNIYRSSAANPLPVFFRSVPGGLSALTTSDVANGTTTLFNTQYTYYVTSLVVLNGAIVESLPSNTATGIVKRLFVAATNPSINYLAAIPSPLFTVTGLDQPLPAGATCTTTATAGSNAGTYPIVCSGPATTANPANGITYTNGTLTILPIPQVIAFAGLANRTFGDAAFGLVASAPGGPVTFSATGSCSVSGSLVTITGAGSCTIRANQAGSINYLPAPPVDQTFTIAQAPQVIAFNTLPNRTFGDAAFAIGATAPAGPVTFGATGNCTVAGNLVSLTGAGSCAIRATQPGNANYLAANPVDQTFSIAQAPQVINFLPLPNVVFGAASFTVTATAPGGPVTFSATGTCLVAGNTVSITGAGSCVVRASQAGGGNFLPATPVDQGFAIAPAPQTINFAALPNRTFGDAPFTVSATAPGGTVTFSATGNCSVNVALVTLTAAGSCTIRASQAGGGNFQPATPVDQTFTIAPGVTTTSFNYPNFNSTSGLSLNGNATTASGALRLTSVGGQASSTYFSQPVVLTSGFTTTFQFRINAVSNPPADGLAFLVQTGPSDAIGSAGGGIGYNGIPGSLAVEFDTYCNASDFGDEACSGGSFANHVGVQSSVGSAANSADHRTSSRIALNNSPGFNIADGNTHTVEIAYAGNVLTVKVDGAVIVNPSVNIASRLDVAPGGTVRFGFTGATGANSQVTDVLNWSLQTTN